MKKYNLQQFTIHFYAEFFILFFNCSFVITLAENEEFYIDLLSNLHIYQ